MFRESFKYYKSKQPPPDLSTVLRISQTNKDVEVISIPTPSCDNEIEYYNLSLKPIKAWNIYKIKNKPGTGLIFIKNPFTSLGQRYWITRCLKDFSKKPYKLNIDSHNYLNENETWWDIICNSNDKRNLSLLTKLRWATLGYHHNWDTKVYSDSSKDDFPNDLAEMCKLIAEVLGYNDFNAEAAIVNYYFMNSTLSGHTDHSENDLDAPLFSFSFGQSAIFLIGGLTENDPVTPILIESGDVLVMSRESRLCYHAVPKILDAEEDTWNQINEEIEIEESPDNDLYVKCCKKNYWNDFNNFIKTCRLNMNVRQVLKPGQKTLNDQ